MNEISNVSIEFEKLSLQSQAQFDKAILTLSSAAIGVIVSFSKVLPIVLQHKIALWIFLISIFFTLIGLQCSAYVSGAFGGYFVTKNVKVKQRALSNMKFFSFFEKFATVAAGSTFFIGMVFTILGFTL